mgnify:CR=1 FL=1
MALLKSPNGIGTRSNPGVNIGQWGSDIFVLNADTKTAEVAYTDPVGIFAGTSLNSKVFFYESIPGSWSTLDLYHAYSGTDPATALKVRAYGFVPMDVTPLAGRRVLPYDINNSSTLTNLTSTTPGWWIPLSDPSTGDISLTFGNTAAISNSGTDPKYKLSGKRSVSLLGCAKVMALVEQAADNVTEGWLVGRFVSV